MRALVVEDNRVLAAAIQRGLQEHGYAVDACHGVNEAEERLAENHYDLLVLDVMLPDGDGVVLCRALRRRKLSTYVLMLTALSATAEKISGLEAGADDYLTKPFEFEEFLARVRALLRRGKPSEAVRLEHQGLQLDLLKREVRREGVKIPLRGKEMLLLELLLRNADRVVDRTTIARTLWDAEREPSSNVIDKYVSSLRQKIDRDFARPLLHTVVGTGYRLGNEEP
ncbi:MAG TPA: response regulator transcription factor [Planctomycetota bacterium]